jgi:hypothetical protein
MRILFDQGTPVPLRGFLISHEVVTAFELGWSEISNGDLLAKAEKEFDVLVTTDKQLKYQQDLASRKLAILGLALRELDQIADECREYRKCGSIHAAGKL